MAWVAGDSLDMGRPTSEPIMTAAEFDPWAENGGHQARDAGIRAALDHRGASWDRATIDQTVKHLASTGWVWTVDDLRELLPTVAGSPLGARILAAAKTGLIERTGSTTTRHPEGHARRVSTWRGTAALNRTMPRPGNEGSSTLAGSTGSQADVNLAATPSDRRAPTEQAASPSCTMPRPQE